MKMSVRNILHFSYYGILLFFFQSSIIITSSEYVDCDSLGTCSACLQKLECVWCIKPIQLAKTENYSVTTHCLLKGSSSMGECPSDLLVNPKSEGKILQQDPLQSAQGHVVQITPQKIKLSMRLGEERQVHFTYAQANNYPVDLYYIMDLSASMEKHRKKLGQLGNKLADAMKNLTSNFRIGFGSFVDKVELPFVSTEINKLASPCTLNTPEGKRRCVPVYSFKNHIALTTNHELFSYEVSQAEISGNLDTPEGGFDAIMQAIVCKKKIGWRDKARHLLIFSTDALFHIAGDGKLAGVMEPNDAQCHMSKDQYEDYLTYDYPSVSLINHIAKRNNINLIFAIAASRGNVINAYKTLSGVLENSNVGELDANSNNIIDLVLENYNKIVDSVVIDTNAPEDIEVKISSNCRQPIGRGCSDIHVGEVVNFTATIKPLSCTGLSKQPIIITLKPEGIDESVTVELDVSCSCDCEKLTSRNYFPKSPLCSNVGDLACGVCICPEGLLGSKCDCSESDPQSHNDTNCYERPGAKMCSGKGLCQCGRCKCFEKPKKNQKYGGKFCQCDNYSCNQENGQLCAGRGDCICGVCHCKAGWSGSACECRGGNETCIKPGYAKEGICSGKGECKCGKCECLESYYTGKYCEECPTCKEKCGEINECVECKVFRTGALKGGNCDLKCSVYFIEEVDEINENEIGKGEKKCRFLSKDDCSIIYKYLYDKEKNLIVKVQKTRSCPINIWVWIVGVVGTIVLAGVIMLLIWKIFTTIHDRREYVKFENEKKNMKWNRNENPLYKNATTSFQNPFYKS